MFDRRLSCVTLMKSCYPSSLHFFFLSFFLHISSQFIFSPSSFRLPRLTSFVFVSSSSTVSKRLSPSSPCYIAIPAQSVLPTKQHPAIESCLPPPTTPHLNLPPNYSHIPYDAIRRLLDSDYRQPFSSFPSIHRRPQPTEPQTKPPNHRIASLLPRLSSSSTKN